MSYSLNEIEALAKRASRGAGLSWGAAEEAGKACRWLASHDLPGGELLADLLTLNDLMEHEDVAPVSLDGVWRSRSGALCPLAAGMALNDCADRLGQGHSVGMGQISFPLLVVPFAALAAKYISAPVTVAWHDTSITTDGNLLWIDDPKSQIGVASVASLTCTRATQIDDRAQSPTLRGNASDAAWTCLNKFAHRTYAPATPESRLLGAGAGASDND